MDTNLPISSLQIIFKALFFPLIEDVPIGSSLSSFGRQQDDTLFETSARLTECQEGSKVSYKSVYFGQEGIS